ncbi:putative H/ACA ribonucleoprotein complex subunit 1-like protein 1 [Histomonas meleagridis]|uniref:putative H/ACA ribonucleoprotein complex subunit 1-like protein 1 n=1 Tax=Histomonas meleagridis TaxID=135588 RepID=UPI00355AB8DB|nr:putative H/ACA ribonucleoprotein complex subunit 1-like protein 1 [Histomonas meleagridis]KAH0798481.1 putative H/ACA ribonucleoprotein complex subunit 1-like protein 1 [Histomonas meleagridis]
MRGRGNRGGSNQSNRGGNRNNSGNRGGNRDESNVQTAECGTFVGLCEGNAIFQLSTKDRAVPFTKTFLYDAKKNKVGEIKDVFGPLDKVQFVMEPINPSFVNTLKEGSKIYAPADRLRPESFFLSDQNARRGGGRGGKKGGGNRGGNRGGGRGGNRGGNRGGRGNRRF